MNVLNGVTSPYRSLCILIIVYSNSLSVAFCIILTVIGSCFLTMPVGFNFIHSPSSRIHLVMSFLVYTPIVNVVTIFSRFNKPKLGFQQC